MPRHARLFAVAATLALVFVPAVSTSASAAVAGPVRSGFAALPGDVSDFEFRSFDAEYTLTRDAEKHAHLDVVETAVAVFPSIDQNHGIIRAIPDYYGDVFLDTTVLGVVDENGAPVPYNQTSDGGFTLLQIGEGDVFVHGTKTYVIHYTQVDTIRYFSDADTDEDEFYWDVNGTGWEQPFAEVSAAVTLAADLAPTVQPGLSCYQGPAGTSTECSEGVSNVGDTVFTAGARDLEPGENLTIVIPFLPHTFVEGVPSDPNAPIDLGPAPPVWGVVLSLFGWLAFALGIVGAVVLRRKRAVATSTIIPQYSVPKGLDVMVAAELIGKRPTALQAQIVSLAVKRKIRLLGYPVQDATTADYAVQLVDATGLESWEQAVVDALFGPAPASGDARDLQRSGDADLSAALSPIVAALPGAVTESGFEGAPASTRGSRWFVLGAITLTVAGIVGAIAAGWIGLVLGAFATIIGIAGIGLAAFAARRRPTLSPAGAQWVDYLLGMKMYLELAEKDRFKMLQSATGADRIDTSDGRQVVKLYEKLLPWAIIWGIEDSWARELEIQLQQTGQELDWYVGTTGFQSAYFLGALSGLAAGTSAPVTTSGSSWSDSGGSSFSGGSFGGGSSGGGGGGGGGGGW
ncbi:MAG: DUF2207 domain-containing protein [Pseudolysinimonas sp.]